MHDHEANIHPVKLAAVTPESKLHGAGVRVRLNACHPQVVTFSVPKQGSSETLGARLCFVSPVTASLIAVLLSQDFLRSQKPTIQLLSACCVSRSLPFLPSRILASLGPSSSSRQTTPHSFLGFCGSSRVDRRPSQPRPEAELQSAESAGALFYSPSSPSLPLFLFLPCLASGNFFPLDAFKKTRQIDRRLKEGEQSTAGQTKLALVRSACVRDTTFVNYSTKAEQAIKPEASAADTEGH